MKAKKKTQTLMWTGWWRPEKEEREIRAERQKCKPKEDLASLDKAQTQSVSCSTFYQKC